MLCNAQCAEGILNKIAKPLNETFTGLNCMLKGLRIVFLKPQPILPVLALATKLPSWWILCPSI